MSAIISDRKRKAYQCLRCWHKEGKMHIDARYRIMHHILKKHVTLDETPFYCSLCLFKSFSGEELKDHVRSYPRHRLMLKEKGIVDCPEMLVSNTIAFQVTDRDMVALSTEESQAHWAKMAKRQTPQEDPVTQAINIAFPGGLPAPRPLMTPRTAPNTPVLNHQTLTRMATLQHEPGLSLVSPANPVLLAPSVAQPAVSPGFPLQAAGPSQQCTIAMQQLQQLISSAFQPVFGALLPTEQRVAAVSSPAQPRQAATPAAILSEVLPSKPVDLALDYECEENILKDILPSNRSTPRLERSRPTSPVPSVRSDSSSSSSSSSPSSADAMEKKMLSDLKIAVERNTSALRSQEKMLKEMMGCILNMSASICGETKERREVQTQTEEERGRREEPPAKRRREEQNGRDRDQGRERGRNGDARRRGPEPNHHWRRR